MRLRYSRERTQIVHVRTILVRHTLRCSGLDGHRRGGGGGGGGAVARRVGEPAEEVREPMVVRRLNLSV